MRSEHRDIQKWIKQRHSRTGSVAAEIDQQNFLPDRQRHWYQPDVILRNRNGDIEYIIEVENDPVRKALVGASILADYSIGHLKQRAKPKLIFVIYTDQGIKQRSNFKAKLKIAKEYCLHLRNIEVHSVEDFKKLQL